MVYQHSDVVHVRLHGRSNLLEPASVMAVCADTNVAPHSISVAKHKDTTTIDLEFSGLGKRLSDRSRRRLELSFPRCEVSAVG